MTNQIIISDISIRQDSEGRYSINDLHKASGSEQKDKPVHWLALQKTTDLIETIEKVGNLTFPPIRTTRGRNLRLQRAGLRLCHMDQR